MISYDLQVYRFDMENETFLSLPYSNYQAKSIHPLHYGRTWIITNAGDLIETYNSTDRKLFTHNFFEKNHLSKNKVYNLLEDDENNVWILSQAGIYKVIFNNTSLYKIHYYKLPNSVYDVIETDSDIYFLEAKEVFGNIIKRGSNLHYFMLPQEVISTLYAVLVQTNYFSEQKITEYLFTTFHKERLHTLRLKQIKNLKIIM